MAAPREHADEENETGQTKSCAASSARMSPAPVADPHQADVASPPELIEQLQKLQKEKQELTDLLVRRQADFENYRKRAEKERHQERQRTLESFMERLLPVLDAFDNALAPQQEPAGEEFRRGFELIRRQLADVLAKQGVSRIEAVGRKFDPHVHHAIQNVETAEHPAGTVIGELQPGYMFHERVLRPAMVRVAAEPHPKHADLAKHDN
jgi:molecular chaperone GrpE